MIAKTTMEITPLHKIGISIGLGLLVGLQREWAQSPLAGIRTFPLITVLGAICGLLAAPFGGWVIAAGFVGLAAMIIMGNVTRVKAGKFDPGITTEITALVMFAVGSLIAVDYIVEGLTIGGGVAVLLHWKKPLHELVQNKIGEADVKAIMRFVLIALVILPVLPNKAFGPYDVLNPFEIWLMVVLIVGISLSAYVVYKLLGASVGTLLAGVLGGLISSTATTVSLSRESRDNPADAPASAVVIIIASTIVFGRVILEVAVVAPTILPAIIWPMGIMTAFMVVIAAGSFLFYHGELAKPVEREAPTNLWGAIIFGLLYAAVLFGISWGKHVFGDSGLYVVAGMSGLTDMDAITLSTAQLVKSDQLEASTGWRLILVGALTNIAFKGAMVYAMGGKKLAKRIAVQFGLMLVGGLILLFAWPT